MPANTGMSQFYGLPKSHKPGLPLPPVASTCNIPTGGLSLLTYRTTSKVCSSTLEQCGKLNEADEEGSRYGRRPFAGDDGCIKIFKYSNTR